MQATKLVTGGVAIHN